ncbi:RNA polymerase sigma factor [Solirubrobacter taibaiensis]|nr:RNA polymerase sigma factor [Solirubrobacter taibaiensis]
MDVTSRSTCALARSVREPAAFSRFYEAEAPRLLIFFARRTCDPHAALDLCAETFAEAFAGRRRFRGDTDDDARAWLYGIAQHRLSRFFRRGATERRALARLGMQVPELTVDDIDQIEREADLAGVRDRVRAGLEDLSDDHREALRLRVVEELPYDEVAHRLGVSEPTARARVSRGLRALGRVLSHEGGLA